MATKQVQDKRNRTPQKNSKNHKEANGSTKKSTSKSEDKNKINVRESANGDASSEDNEFAVVPSSSVEPEDDGVVESEEDVAKKRSSSDEGEEEEKETLQSMKEKRKNVGMKSKGKKKSKKEDDESEEEETSEDNLYRFPMNRVSRIIKGENPDVKIAQEAVFVINRASERFLQLFSKEVYACAVLDNKKQAAYNHLCTAPFSTTSIKEILILI